MAFFVGGQLFLVVAVVPSLRRLESVAARGAFLPGSSCRRGWPSAVRRG
jgi:hypothetical protein